VRNYIRSENKASFFSIEESVTLIFPGLIVSGGALGLAILAWHARRRPDFPGRREFVRAMLAASWWSAAAAGENFALAPADKVFWAEMAWPGIIAAPMFWMMFVWTYCRGEKELSARPWSAC